MSYSAEEPNGSTSDIEKLNVTEKRYPLIKEIIDKMLNWKLEAEAESTMAFELLKFIKSQRSSDEDLHEGQSTKGQKFRYILQVIKLINSKKLDGLLGKDDSAAEETKEITLSSYCC
nr:hypothetical protein [Tanacetum cinerariifolium]